METIELFPPLSTELLAMLRSLTPVEWAASTVCGSWSVKDVAAHLLGGSLGRLWHNKGAPATPDIPYERLLALINDNNDQWVRAARRISPEMLMEFLQLTDQRLYNQFRTLSSNAPARAAVAWAGDAQSPNWFDIAREYTEKWLHQQHIREAVRRPLLVERRWLYPVLDTLLHGLPHAFRHVTAADDVVVTIHIVGEAGGVWSLLRQGSVWKLYLGERSEANTRVQIDEDLAWRLFSKGIGPEIAASRIRILGDRMLGAAVLEMVSIMA